MRSTAAFILAVAAATLVAVCVVQARKSVSQQTQLATLKTELQSTAQQAEEARAAQQEAERQRDAAAMQPEDSALRSRGLPHAATNAAASMPAGLLAAAETNQPAPEKGGLAKVMSEMMRNPESRELLREQQRTMMDQLYTPLIKRMGLTPEEADQFEGMLTDHTVEAALKAYSVAGNPSANNPGGALGSIAADQKSFDEQVKAFLGDARYAQYQQYQETAAQRMQLNAWKLQAGTDYTLTEPQTESLLSIMQEEQKNAAAAAGLPTGDFAKDPSKLQSLFTEDKLDQFMEAQSTANQRVYDRAQSVLSPEQLASFGQFQTNALRMMRASMGVMKGLFGGEKPAPPQNP